MRSKKNDVRTISVRQIEKNTDLLLGTPAKDIAKYEKVVMAFGNVAPAVVAANGGMYRLVDGQARLEACARMGTNEIPAVVAQTDGAAEEMKLSLLLSASREQGSPLGEGALIEKLVNGYGETLPRLSELTGRSKSWLSKRQSMSRNLSAAVKEMVTHGTVCARSAEEVSKLPQEEQAVFAANIANEGLCKEDVCRLVRLYRSPGATLELCREIIASPSNALAGLAKAAATRKAHRGAQGAEGRLRSAANFAMNLLDGLAKILCGYDDAALGAEMDALLELHKKLAVISALVHARIETCLSPGKQGDVKND